MKWILIGLATITLSGCSYQHHAYLPCQYRVQSSDCYQQEVVVQQSDADLIATTQQAADKLLEMALTVQHLAPRRLLMTTVADINDLDDSSAFGRLLGEQLAARFVEHGYAVIEPKMRHTVEATPRRGEFVMSRYLRELGRMEDTSAAVAGTYAIADDTVFITLKMLSFYDGQMLASYNYSLPLGANTQALLDSHKAWWHW